MPSRPAFSKVAGEPQATSPLAGGEPTQLLGPRLPSPAEQAAEHGHPGARHRPGDGSSPRSVADPQPAWPFSACSWWPHSRHRRGLLGRSGSGRWTETCWRAFGLSHAASSAAPAPVRPCVLRHPRSRSRPAPPPRRGGRLSAPGTTKRPFPSGALSVPATARPRRGNGMACSRLRTRMTSAERGRIARFRPPRGS